MVRAHSALLTLRKLMHASVLCRLDYLRELSLALSQNQQQLIQMQL